MLIKIIGIGLVCVILSLLFKQYRPEFSILVSVCGALIIFFMMITGLEEIVGEVFNISQLTGISSELFVPVIKVVGVGYITEFVSDIAEDGGNKTLSNKIIMGGKIAICVISLPIIKNLINTILSVIS